METEYRKERTRTHGFVHLSSPLPPLKNITRHPAKKFAITALGDGEGGFAKVWLCSPGGRRTMARLGEELEMMAPTRWWSDGRRPCTHLRASPRLCLSTLRLL